MRGQEPRWACRRKRDDSDVGGVEAFCVLHCCRCIPMTDLIGLYGFEPSVVLLYLLVAVVCCWFCLQLMSGLGFMNCVQTPCSKLLSLPVHKERDRVREPGGL
jgi:hypothetical protein